MRCANFDPQEKLSVVPVSSSCTYVPGCRPVDDGHNDITHAFTANPAVPGALALWEEKFGLSSGAAGAAKENRQVQMTLPQT